MTPADDGAALEALHRERDMARLHLQGIERQLEALTTERTELEARVAHLDRRIAAREGGPEASTETTANALAQARELLGR